MYLALTALVVVAIFVGAIVAERLTAPSKLHNEPVRAQLVMPTSRVVLSPVMLPSYSLHARPDGVGRSSNRA